MTQIPHTPTNRRRYLKGVGLGLATVVGVSAPAAADEENTLEEPPGFFAIYAGGASGAANEPSDFGFPEAPFFSGANVGGEGGLFDGDGIRITPNQNTLHHNLRFFAGLLMERKPKPYPLVHHGGGYFESRGQTVNFTARSADDMQAAIEHAMPPELAELKLPYNLPLSTLAGGKWRAVATDQMQVDLTGDPQYASEWANTRVDFYTRGGGRPEYKLSLLYVLWADQDALTFNPEEDPPAPEGTVKKKAKELIRAGKLNMGGQ